MGSPVDAVIFDLDGVLVDSEDVWDVARRDLAQDAGRSWPPEATEAMMGMSSVEWSRYLHEHVDIPLEPAEISSRVVERLEEHYRREVPWIAGAREAIIRLGERWPLGLASSSNREIIDTVLELGDLAGHFGVTLSSEEVERGKPAPDVYLEVAARLEAAPERCAAIEDSSNGLRSAHAAGMRVIAIPHPAHPPAPDALALAAVVLDALGALTPDVVEGPLARLACRADDAER